MSVALHRARRVEKLARALRRLREERFVTEADAAQEAGLSMLDVMYLERAGTLPEQSLGHYFALCVALGTRPSEVLAVAERLAEKDDE